MAILSREQYFARLQERLGNDTTDEGISFLEDMTDTYNDMEGRSKGDGIDWEKKYHELDESWKTRYRHRFFSGGDSAIPSTLTKETEVEEYNPDSVTVEDLFTKKEEK